MELTTKCRYGARLMLDLALHRDEGVVMLKEIAKRQEISEKYFGQIIIPLKGAGFVASYRCAHGGYMLAKDPKDITLKGIVYAVQGGSTIVDCIRADTRCSRSGNCTMRDVWCRLDDVIEKFLTGVTLKTLAEDAQRDMDDRVMKYHAMAF